VTKKFTRRSSRSLRQLVQPWTSETSEAREARAAKARAVRAAHDEWLLQILRGSLANATSPEVRARLHGAIERLQAKVEAA
jgi:hypothetical protein